MDLLLNKKRVVVTGGSSGIGFAIVRAFLQEGAEVWFCGRTATKIEKAVNELGEFDHSVHAAVVDVCNRNEFEAWIDTIPEIDVFVPNVSALSDSWEEVVRVDITSTQSNIETVIHKLTCSSTPVITYIGSKAGGLSQKNAQAYGAGKAAMAHYMKSLALTHAPEIRVNTVSPGDTYVENGLWGNVKQEKPDEFLKVLARNPMNRLATPEEVANVVVFISSARASYVSGANWYVDGASVNQVQY
ncbi:SDR family oxidoreductase [Vibrio sp. Of14-4]|uniref:SDR family NAD(P)-dependent oxidoreductase n=1 Tax=Vibrio sp. Of14-4 TaxID=2724878 RepID=UPI001EF2D7B5|nr:SDR family oxidoreductase [Vibrio sp. Of14-4]MCG7488192.1 SDR family oxidoreductase [Vibrio sp. Of14-4]